MAFSQAFLDELIFRNPIEDVVGQYVALSRHGSNLFGLCPFHAEKTPSFSVAPDKQIYYCFGCHKGGGVIGFIMEQENLDFPDAVRFLAKRAGMEIPEEDESARSAYRRQEQLWALLKDAARYFHECLNDERGAVGRDYVYGKRVLSRGTVTKFGIGFAPNSWSGLLEAMTAKGYEKKDLLDAGLVLASKEKGSFYDRFRNRLMFPIIDVRGNVIGFGGRVMDDSTPKYLNSPETAVFNKRKNLFALNLAKKSKSDFFILTEGYMDAVALHQYGFDCAVASLGTALTTEHAALLAKYIKQVVLTYDGDDAGQNATQRAIPLLENAGLQVKVLKMEGAKDPDEFLKKFGADRFRILLGGSENRVAYQLGAIRSRHPMNSDEDKISFLQEAAALVSSLRSPVEREIYGERAAQAAGISADAMKLEIDKAYRKRLAREKKKQEKVDLAPAAALQPNQRELHYSDVRSAAAEEGLLRLVLMEPALFDRVEGIDGAQFSAPLLGRAFDALRQRFENGQTVSLAALEGSFSPEETAHLIRVSQRGEGLVSETALGDCIRTIRTEYERRSIQGEDDLLRLRDRYKEKKGYGG